MIQIVISLFKFNFDARKREIKNKYLEGKKEIQTMKNKLYYSLFDFNWKNNCQKYQFELNSYFYGFPLFYLFYADTFV